MTQNSNSIDESMRLALIMPISELKATACNAFMHFHGQEEGTDPTMDRYNKQEKEAEKKLYKAIDRYTTSKVVEALEKIRVMYYQDGTLPDVYIDNIKLSDYITKLKGVK